MLDPDGDLDVSWYTDESLLELAFDRRQQAQLDQSDMSNVIRELAIRLQKAKHDLYNLGS